MLRAVGIVRVSQPKGRKGEKFVSPKEQREAIKRYCADHGWRITDDDIYDELKVSGDAPLEDRPGLSRAVSAVLTSAADVIVGAYSERLWWSHEVRAQVLRLVREAGGEVWAVDAGLLSDGSAAEDFSAEVRTSADRFSRRQNAEKSRRAVEDAVARGVCPFADVPPGLALDEENRVIQTDELPIALSAFELRDREATIKEVRAFLKDHGIDRSYHGVQSMLSNKLYLGEIHFGSLVNRKAHKLAIPRDLFNRVQKKKASRGRRAKSDRLLARLGLLHCGSCGARMVVGTQKQNGRSYPFYRCPPVGDCERRVTIGAEIAEGVIVEATKRRAREVKGEASAAGDARADAEAAERAQANLDAAIRAFAGLEEEAAAVERLAELARIRDEAAAQANRSRDVRSALTIDVDDWDDLSVSARRSLIRTTIDRATVGSTGKGAGRITVYPFSE
ncbi:MAG TPA: recombinase family protein [Solirubrobacterales bacterium]|jgi:DNA invertase Pin-like site-specific DNA recombinase